MNKTGPWRRIETSYFLADDGWSVRGGPHGWFVFRQGELWGRWRAMRGWRRYMPFQTLRQARAAVDDHLLTVRSAA